MLNRSIQEFLVTDKNSLNLITAKNYLLCEIRIVTLNHKIVLKVLVQIKKTWLYKE